MAYNSPNQFPYYAAVNQQQQQQRFAYQQLQMQQAPQHVQRDVRAQAQDALRRLSSGTPRASVRRPSEHAQAAIPEVDDAPPLSAGYGQQHRQQQHHYASYATSPTSRSTTAPPSAGFVPALSSLTLPPIRGGAAVPMSPPTRAVPTNIREPYFSSPSVPGASTPMTPNPTSGHGCSRKHCYRRFPTKPELDAHEKIHRYSEKPVPCDQRGCDWRFEHPSDARHHHDNHHASEKGYSCDFPGCSKQYERKHDLFCHVRDRHPGHPVPAYT